MHPASESLRVLSTWLLLASIALAAPSLRAAPAELPGFPVRTGLANTSNGLLVTDLGDGKPSIVAVAGEGVTVLDVAGKTRPGFPVRVHEDAVDTVSVLVAAAPAACDLSGDGTPAILFAGSNNRLFAVTPSGAPRPGFPVTLDGVAKGPISCLPQGSGKAHDILLTTDAGSVLRIGGGGGKPQQVARLGEGAETAVALAEAHEAGVYELVVGGGGDATLYMMGLQGKRKGEGFAYRMGFRATGTPALVDLNDDGVLDVVVGSEDFKIHAVGLDGKALPGFPVATEYRIYGGVCIGDLDADGVPEVVAGSGDSRLYAVKHDGKPLPGFPLKVDGRISTGCVLADFDADGHPEIAVVTQGGSVYVVDWQGNVLPEFPWKLGGKLEVAPAAADLDGDGRPELVVEDRQTFVHAVGFPNAGKVPKVALAWPMVGRDSAHTGHVRDTPGRFKDLGWVNPEPLTTDPLEVSYRFFDLDREPERDTQIRWYLGGAPQPDLDNKRVVPAARTKKHEHWYYTLQEGDNFITYGEKSVLSQIFVAPPVEIRNTPPTLPGIALTPGVPSTLEALHVAVTQASHDTDDDPLTYRYLWLRDGRVLRQDTGVTDIAAAQTRKNEVWRVRVMAYDGEVEGPVAEANVSIRNTVPGSPAFTWNPNAPRIDDRVALQVTRAAPDPDADPITYKYHYWVNNKPLDLAEDANTVPARALHKHDLVRMRVTAWDDEAAGGSVEGQLEVVNTPPPPPAVAIWPPHPRTRDDLSLGVTEAPPDTDGDPVALRHRWSVDGAMAEHGPVVPHATTRKGQAWRLQVIPFDGEAEGAAVVVETRIENTPPTAPVLILDHYELLTDEAVQPQVLIPAADDDGDPVRVKYRWERNGQAVTTLPDTQGNLAAADTKKGERWRLTATPFDGEADGLPSTLDFAIINTPPSAPVLALSHTEPTVLDPVMVKIAVPATDRDGDALVYRYRWSTLGKPAPFPLTQDTLPPRTGHKGERWRVEVRAFDGEAEGAPAVAELRFANHPPTPPAVSVAPATPRTDDPLTCRIDAPGTDADGDPLTYRFRWIVDDAPRVLADDLAVLPAALTFEKARWTCEVRAFDGAALSAPARAAPVTVVNTPPVAPVVTITPRLPHTDDPLVCSLLTPAADADADPVRYRYVWHVDSKPWSPDANAPPNVVPPTATSRGQNWECSVTPTDGKADGPTAHAVATIQNTAPTAPKVVIAPDRPRPGEPLRCEVVAPAQDADGDPVTYAYAWAKDGVTQSFPAIINALPGPGIKARDVWTCTVTPRDSVAAGPSATSQDVAVLEPVKKKES
jgi:hypothetical protein